jgi:electron transfer flavoprotein alpha subunit
MALDPDTERRFLRLDQADEPSRQSPWWFRAYATAALMRAAVFIKQVPDLRAGSVGTRPDGTIDRGSAPTIMNPVDLHALEAALQVADEVVAITMGPQTAEAVLREALSRGAASGALATDPAFAGSDTWATANVLAAVVRHLGDFDLLLCGLSALDGETGQVGPQLAVRLGVPHATGCESVAVHGERLQVRRVVEGGYETLSLPFPALLTITETGFTPRYPTLPLRQYAVSAELVELSAVDLGLAADRIGLEASPTKVAHMEMVKLPSVETQYVGTDLSYEQLVASLRSRGALLDRTAGAGSLVADTGKLPTTLLAEATPVVWVVCELTNRALAAVSAELLTKARELASDLEGGVAAFIAAHEPDQAIDEAAVFGPDVVLVAADERLSPYRTMPHARVLHQAIVEYRPQVVLLGATSTGRDLAPRVAAMLDTGLAADCTDLHVADWTRRGHTYKRLLHQVRPAMASTVLATCICPRARPQMATIRPGVFSLAPAPRRSRVESVAVDLLPEDLLVDVVDRHVEQGLASLSDASIVVAGGAGCSAESWHLVEDLATALGGRVGASRAAVEAGLAPRAFQVGQTGTTIKPELYVACGISGEFQHTVGMRAARTVVAVNRNPEATIFRFAHFGVVADVVEALPLLTAALRASQWPGDQPR